MTYFCVDYASIAELFFSPGRLNGSLHLLGDYINYDFAKTHKEVNFIILRLLLLGDAVFMTFGPINQNNPYLPAVLLLHQE